MSASRRIGGGLALMSFSSGCIDILGYRFLGDVFTSAMTGNVALMGLAVGQGQFAAATRNLTAFGSFLSGLLLGAVILRGGSKVARLLATLLTEAALLAAFAAAWGLRGADPAAYALIAVAASAMGLQSAAAHRIGMPGITTTYFTGTLTNIVFRLVAPARAQPRGFALPLLSFGCYVAGAVTAGWYTVGRSAHELPLVLPILPCAATLVLVTIVAMGDKDDWG